MAVRERVKERKTGRENKPMDVSILCNAKRKDGTYCRKPKGWGTNHPGYGKCRYHGGSTRNHGIAAAREMAMERMRTYGGPIEIDPHEALLQEVKRSAGHVKWLGDLIGKFESHEDLKQYSHAATNRDTKETIFTWERPAVWVQMYQDERQHLAKVCKMALDAGVAEKQVQIAETQGQIMAAGIQLLLEGLGLTKQQWQKAPGLVRRAFTEVMEVQELEEETG